MGIIRKGSQANSKLAMLVLGDVGTHKSEIALESVKLKNPDGTPMRVLYIDVENGSVDDRLERFAKDGIDLNNLLIVYEQSFDEINKYIKMAKEHEDFTIEDEDGNEEVILDASGKPFHPDMIVIDGMKLLYDARQQVYIERSKRRATNRANKNENISALEARVIKEGAKLEPTDYQALKMDGVNLILNLVGSGCHFVVTAFAKKEMVEAPELGKDNFGNIRKKPTGNIINEGFAEQTKYAKTILVMDVDDFGEVIGTIERKDRTEVFQAKEIIKDPHLTMWQPAIDKTAGKTIVIENKIDENIDKDVNKLDIKDKIITPEELKQEHNVKSVTNTSDWTAEQYYTYIKCYIDSCDKEQKNMFGKKLTEFGLSKNYKSVKDIQVLKQYFDLIEKLK